ncbi:unnamed protein product, partial [Rotaria sp. Silwood2]
IQELRSDILELAYRSSIVKPSSSVGLTES